MKYYFFRDLNHEDNLLEGKTYHSAGYVDSLNCELDNPNKSGKDLSVTFFEPFTAELISTWRSLDEVELFEVDEYEYNLVIERYGKNL